MDYVRIFFFWALMKSELVHQECMQLGRHKGREEGRGRRRKGVGNTNEADARRIFYEYVKRLRRRRDSYLLFVV